ncbi:MAG: hypothetical protein ACE5J5_05775 [Candidatus Hydrothermarchaeales archaeon]
MDIDLYEELTNYLLKYSKKIDRDNSMPLSENRRRLNKEQKGWLKKRRKDLDGKTPFEVVMEEREKLGDVLKGWE